MDQKTIHRLGQQSMSHPATARSGAFSSGAGGRVLDALLANSSGKDVAPSIVDLEELARGLCAREGFVGDAARVAILKHSSLSLPEQEYAMMDILRELASSPDIAHGSRFGQHVSSTRPTSLVAGERSTRSSTTCELVPPAVTRSVFRHTRGQATRRGDVASVISESTSVGSTFSHASKCGRNPAPTRQDTRGPGSERPP